MTIYIDELVQESIVTKRNFFEQNKSQVERAANQIVTAMRSNHKLLLFGNGGSAADAQHIAAEFVNRYRTDRRALPAIALTADTSVITSIGNDSSYEYIFSRQLEALAQSGDVALAISTSGNSPNVVAGVQCAKRMDVFTIGMTGRDGGEIGRVVDLHLNVDTPSTARTQEVHILIAHILCEIVEDAFIS